MKLSHEGWEKLAVRRDTASELLEVSTQKIDDLIAAHELDAIRVGRSVRVTVESLRRYVDAAVTAYLLAE